MNVWVKFDQSSKILLKMYYRLELKQCVPKHAYKDKFHRLNSKFYVPQEFTEKLYRTQYRDKISKEVIASLRSELIFVKEGKLYLLKPNQPRLTKVFKYGTKPTELKFNWINCLILSFNKFYLERDWVLYDNGYGILRDHFEIIFKEVPPEILLTTDLRSYHRKFF